MVILDMLFCGDFTTKNYLHWRTGLLIPKLANSNVGGETSFPVSVAFTPAALPSKLTALAAVEHKQEVSSLNLNFS